MPSRSTSQLAIVNQRQDDDLLYGVRDNGSGVWSDLALRVGDLAPEILRASITIPTAEVLTLNTTPVTVLTATSGQIPIPLFVVVNFSGGTTPYATNTTLRFYADSATIADYFASMSINKNAGVTMVAEATPLGLYQADPNANIVCQVLTGDPTAGDNDLNITLYYRLIDA